MNLYQPTITGSLSVSGSVNISGSISIAGGGTISGTASIATTALTASSADNFLVRNTLTAQTLVVQTITSSVDFVTGSTRFGSLLANTHVFTGSVLVTGSIITDGIITSNTTIGAALPSASGASQSDGLRLRLTTAGSSTAVIDYGTAGGNGGWIQATNKSDLATNYSLLLNPNGGGVGIGTTNIRASLQISNSTSGIPSIPSLGQSGSYTSLYVTNLNPLYGMLMGSLNNGNSWIQVQRTDGTAAAYSLVMQPNGGSVGIGISPSYLLHLYGSKSQLAVEGNSSNGAGILLNTNLSGTDRRNWFIGTEENIAGDFVIKSSNAAGGNANSGTTRIAILSNGNVGIGTTNPGTTLHVQSTTPATIRLSDDGVYNSYIRSYYVNFTSTYDISTERTDGGSFECLLLISSVLVASGANFNTYTFAVGGRGTNASATQLHNQAGGTASRSAISVSFPSNGVIRLTLTGGETCNVKITLIGLNGV